MKTIAHNEQIVIMAHNGQMTIVLSEDIKAMKNEAKH